MNSQQLQLSNQICFPIYSASRLITKAYKPHLDKIGLTYPQYLVLMVLWETNGLTVNQISARLILNTNTISPLLKRMEKMGLLHRKRSNEDERNVIVRLTTKGEKLKARAMPIPEKLLKVLLTENIQLSEIVQLKEMLTEWITILSDHDKNLNKTEVKRNT
jgi:DNA-binding MarR family transcriptional regulator